MPPMRRYAATTVGDAHANRPAQRRASHITPRESSARAKMMRAMLLPEEYARTLSVTRDDTVSTRVYAMRYARFYAQDTRTRDAR